MTTVITTNEQIDELVESLLDPKRKRPACVVSTPNKSLEPLFDVEGIESETGQVCDVYLVVGGELTRHMQSLMPYETHVYGGAARVYASGFSEAAPELAGRIRYVYPAGAVSKSTDRLTGEIWTAANAAGLLAKPSVSAKPAAGKVVQIYGDASVLIKLTNGDLTTIRQEVTFPGVPMSWLFKVGQSVSGKFDSGTRIFTLDRPGSTVEEIVATIGTGNVTLGLVRSTDRKSAKIAMHPNVEFEVRKDEITGNPRDTVDGYLGVGDVVPVRLYRDPQGRIRLRMDDIDDDETLHPALVLVEGGEPWLVEGRVLFEPIEDNFVDVEALADDSDEVLSEDEFGVSAVVVPTPSEVVAPAKLNNQQRLHQAAIAHYLGVIKRGNRLIEGLRESNRALKLALSDAQTHSANQTEEINRFRMTSAGVRKSKVVESRSGSTAFSRCNRFETAEDWYREEIRRAWLKDFTPSERKAHTLLDGHWLCGEDFLEGVTAKKLDDNEMRKLTRAVLFLVTGRAAFDHLLEAHPLYENGKPMLIDGDPVMRMHIENGNPQAKRLHYVKKAGGVVELLQVSIHDDFGV